MPQNLYRATQGQAQVHPPKGSIDLPSHQMVRKDL